MRFALLGIICVLLAGGECLLSSLVVFADDSTPVVGLDEKAGALAIRDMLVSFYKAGTATANQWNAMDAKIAGYQKQFGVTPQTTDIVIQLRQMEIAIAAKLGDETRYNALMQKLSTDPLPEVAAMAADQIAMQKRLAEIQSKPMRLKFTAVDGRAVDLSKMQGKVVLIDFWATWCPDCIENAPKVQAAYKKYHDKGFEIVGISLDQDKDKLLAFTKDHGMTWPQYFDGEGWNNAVSKDFGINEIPAMWLVDKKGMLVTADARDDLAGLVEKLLATH